jgi:hypothetical protein
MMAASHFSKKGELAASEPSEGDPEVIAPTQCYWAMIPNWLGFPAIAGCTLATTVANKSIIRRNIGVWSIFKTIAHINHSLFRCE